MSDLLQFCFELVEQSDWSFIALSVVVATYLAFLLRTFEQYRLRNALFSVGGSHWLLGDLPMIANRVTVPCTNPPRKDMIGLFETLAAAARNASQPLFRLRLFNRFVPYLCRDWCILVDPDITKELLSLEHYGRFAKGDSYKTAGPLIGSGLLSTRDGDEWKAQRKASTGGFKPKMMRKAQAITMETVLSLCSRWEEGGEVVSDAAPRKSFTVDVAADMLFLTVDVLGKVAFSYDFGSVLTPTPEDAPVFSAFDTILKTFTLRGNLANLDWLTAALGIPTESNRRFDAAMARLEGKVNDIISRRLRGSDGGGGGGKGDLGGEDSCEDLLDFFMGRDKKTQRRLSRASSAVSTSSTSSAASTISTLSSVSAGSIVASEDGNNSNTSSSSSSSSNGSGSSAKCPVASLVGGMGRKLVVDNVKTFLFAGHDTTASALSWALYLIARDTEAGKKGKNARQRILDEASAAGIDTLSRSSFTSSTSSSSSLLKLEFLDAVVKEALRLYPSAGFTRRVPPGSSPVTLGKGTSKEVCIPEGVEVFVFPYLLHRDEALWDNATVFDPDRWARKEREKREGKRNAVEQERKGDDSTGEGSAEGKSSKAEPYLPFSLGLRNCVGMRLALTEIKTTLLALLQRYDMEWIPNPEERGDGGEPHVTLYMTLVPNKINIRFTETPEYAATKSF